MARNSGQGAGQVHRHGALAHTAFAAAHGNHLFHAGDGLAFGHLPMAATTGPMACTADRRCPCRRAHFDLHVGDAIHPQGGVADGLGDAGLLALGEAWQG